MRILCVIDNLGSGGAQRQLVQLAISFRANNNNVSFLTYYDSDFYVDALRGQNISITCLNEPNYLRRYIRMRRHIRAGGFDIILSFLGTPSFICAIAGLPKRNWKLVVGERSANPKILKSFKEIVYRYSFFWVDKIVSNSHSNMALVKRANPLIKDSKFAVINNLIDSEKWTLNVSRYIPRRHGKFNLLVMASHRYLKNFRGLIEAVRLLSQRQKEQILIAWYGDKLAAPHYDNSLLEAKRLIDQYGLQEIFSIYPAVENISSVIDMYDGVGLFSHFEGFPNAICEGMASSKMIICSRVSDIPILIKDDVNGYLCDSKNFLSISNALSRSIELSEDRLVQMGALNREIANRIFDKQTIVDAYQNIFFELVKHS